MEEKAQDRQGRDTIFAPATGAVNTALTVVRISGAGAAGAAHATVVHQILSAALSSRYSLWWGAGSDRVAPSLLVCDGLPARENFAALLDGRFGEWGWSGGESDGRADAQDPR